MAVFKKIFEKTFEELCHNIMQLFVWIKDIEVVRIPYKLGAYISIISYKLLFIVNEKFVVSESGDLLPVNIFKQSVLNKLERILIVFEYENGDNRAVRLADTCKQFVFLLPAAVPDLLSNYRCIWEDENRVWFIDKSGANYAILSHSSKLPTAA